MSTRTQLLALMILSLLLSTGCGRVFAGFDGNINHHVSSNDWDDVSYGYLNIRTIPEDAIVSLQATVQASVVMKAGIDIEQKKEFNEKTEWTVIGSTPIQSHKIAISGKDVSRKIGSSMRSNFQTNAISLKIEKPGYQVVTLENIATQPKDSPNELVVELVPDDQ